MKQAKRTDISAKHNLAQGSTHTFDLVLLILVACFSHLASVSPGEVTEVMNGGWRAWCESRSPWGQTMTTQHHHHHHNHHIFICRATIVCNHGDQQGERGRLTLEVGAVSGSVQWPSDHLSPLREENYFVIGISLDSVPLIKHLEYIIIVGIFPFCLTADTVCRMCWMNHQSSLQHDWDWMTY